MSYQIVSLVALLGWLVLAVSGFRSFRMSGRKTLIYVAAWIGIFLLVGLVFWSMGA